MKHPVLSISAHEAPAPESSMGRLLRERGKLTQEDTERVLRLQRESGALFGEAACSLGLITMEDVQQALARQFDFPYLRPGDDKFPEELVAAYQPSSPEVEMLRSVRSQLLLRWFEGGHKALALVCVNPGDGASFFSANLAVVFAQLGKQTLLVDANLRRPQQHRIFRLKGRQGLSDVIAGRAGMEAIAQVDAFSSLFVLPAGTIAPNPQELVSQRAFRTLHDSLADRFDVILIDAPAFSVGADAFDIAARVGGALLIVRKNSTRLDEVQAVNAQLGQHGIDVVGSVLVDF